jgi:hypothetical protein
MQDERIDALVLGLLSEAPGPWQMHEVERELGRGAQDGIGRLVDKGLAHRIDGGFVFTSAAGRYANAVAEKRP